jgi:hypothetical protein
MKNQRLPVCITWEILHTLDISSIEDRQTYTITLSQIHARLLIPLVHNF